MFSILSTFIIDHYYFYNTDKEDGYIFVLDRSVDLSSLSLNSTGNSISPVPFTDTDTALQMEEVLLHEMEMKIFSLFVGSYFLEKFHENMVCDFMFIYLARPI